MLECEGYKMFRGFATVTPRNRDIEPQRYFGTWLYKPDCHCWYCGGHSFPDSIVGDFEEEVVSPWD